MKDVGKIKDACLVIAGQSPQGSSYNEVGIGVEFHQGKKAFGDSIIELSGVWTTEPSKVAEAGDILMSVRAPVGPTNVTNRKICIGRGLAAIRCKNGFLPQYILYSLRNIESKIIGNDGAIFNSINKTQIEDLPLPLLSLSEQQKIVEYLDTSFAKIDAMKANAEKALSEAKALFQSFLKELLEQEWDYVNFKDIFPIKMGKTPPRGDKSSWDVKKETQNKWVSIADISNNEGKIINDTKEYISNSAANKIFKVSKGSLLMSFKLSIGRMAFAGDDLYTNEAIIAIPESEKYLLRFLFYYLSSYNWLSLTEGNEKVKGATLNKTSIGTIQLPVLSVTQQQSIVNTLDSIKSRVDQLQANYDKISQECDALKQSILKQVFE